MFFLRQVTSVLNIFLNFFVNFLDTHTRFLFNSFRFIRDNSFRLRKYLIFYLLKSYFGIIFKNLPFLSVPYHSFPFLSVPYRSVPFLTVLNRPLPFLTVTVTISYRYRFLSLPFLTVTVSYRFLPHIL